MIPTLFTLAAAVLAASTTAAAAQRTFVASFGSDANVCTIAAPCRGFAQALTHTDAGGEIIVLDSAGYGAVTIAQSVSIMAPPGVYAGITVFSGTGVEIDGPQIDVTLHGLNVNGQGALTAGIAFLQGSTLRVERCVVSNTTQSALNIAATGSKSFIVESVFRDTGTTGINIQSGEAMMERVHSENNLGAGVRVDPSGASAVHVSIRDSAAAGNRFWGYVVFADVGETARLAVERSVAFRNGSASGSGFLASGSGSALLTVTRSQSSENNGDGILASGAATVVASDSVFSRNQGFGMRVSGGAAVVRTLQNNVSEDNVDGATSGALVNATLH